MGTDQVDSEPARKADPFSVSVELCFGSVLQNAETYVQAVGAEEGIGRARDDIQAGNYLKPIVMGLDAPPGSKAPCAELGPGGAFLTTREPPLKPNNSGATLHCYEGLGACPTRGPAMRQQPGSRFAVFSAVAVVALALTACTGGEREAAVQLAKSATSKVSSAVGHDTGEIKVSASDAARLASRYHTSSEEVTAVAGQADNYSGWSLPQASADRMAEIAKAAKKNKAVSAGVDIACAWAAGEINSPDQFQSSVAGATAGMAYNDAYAFQTATQQRAERLTQMQADGTAQDKAAAALFCYGYAVVQVE